MSNERMTVCLEDFLQYLLKKWKSILVSVGCGALIFGIVAVNLGKEIVVEPSEQFVYLSKQEKAIEEYMNNSIIMQMDAQNVYKTKTILDNISDISALEIFVQSGEIWRNLEDACALDYLNEILILEPKEYPGEAEITLIHYNEQTSEAYTEYVINELKKFDSKINIAKGHREVCAEDLVLMTQLTKYDLLHKVQSELEIAAAGYIINVSPLIAVIVGALFGMLILTTGLLLKYLVKDQFTEIENIRE